MWTTRQAALGDHDDVLRFWESQGLGQTAEDEWEALVQGSSAIVLLAEVGSELAGTVIAAFDGWRAYIYHVAVAPQHRRRGLAQALIAEAEEHLTLAGARRIYVMVDGENTAGLALAAVSGYLPEGDIGLVKELPSRVPALFAGAARS